MEEDNKNHFTRILIILYVLFLVGLITISFINGQPPFEFDSKIIIVLLIVTILILSEAFDNLTLGKILSLKRQVENKEKEISRVKKENYKLRENIINITSNISQTQAQSTTNVNGLPPQLLQKLTGVTQAQEENFDEENICKNPSFNDSKDEEKEESIPRNRRRQYKRFAEEEAIDRYLKKYNFSKEDLIEDAIFKSAFQDMDPIMEGPLGTRFDGYINSGDREIFIETMQSKIFNPTFLYYKFYTMLSRISFYREARETEAGLVILLIDFPRSEEENFNGMEQEERLLERFQPAISNDLLRVRNINFTEQDIERWNDKIDSKSN